MDSKVRIGIIGCGAIARTEHIPGYRSVPDDCEIVAVCDANLGVAQEVAAECGAKFATSHYSEMWDHVDAVAVATPNTAHAEPTIEALKAGKHVLVEKPMAITPNEALDMYRAAKESGKILQIGLNFRFHPVTKFMDDFIAKGHMGHVYYARAQCLRRRGVPHWGVFISKELNGGGPLIDLGVHILDLTLHLMGYPKPVAVTGSTWDTLGKDPNVHNFFGPYDRSKFTVEDFAVGSILFDNGARVNLESSFMSNGEGDPYQTQLYGVGAGAKLVPFADPPLQIFKEVDQQMFTMTPARLPQMPKMHTAEVQAFVAAIRSGAPSPVPPEQGVMLTAILSAIYESAELGREVPVHLDL